MIIHDLRNPLAAIVSFAYLLESTERGNLSEKGRDYVGYIIKNSDFLNEMCSSMLDVSKMESGQMQLNLAACDFGAIAREVVSRLGTLQGERQIALALPEQPVLVRGDAQLLSRLVQNLIGNALKFVPSLRAGRCRSGVGDGAGPVVPSGTMALASLQSTKKRFSTNSGRGRPGSRAHLFQRAGLTFCKMVVEAHGGKIGSRARSARGALSGSSCRRTARGMRRGNYLARSAPATQASSPPLEKGDQGDFLFPSNLP